jgi:hypothetical protein
MKCSALELKAIPTLCQMEIKSVSLTLFLVVIYRSNNFFYSFIISRGEPLGNNLVLIYLARQEVIKPTVVMALIAAGVVLDH